MSSEHLIETHNLVFSYGSTPLLDGIDFALKRGSLAALIGANGAGKSTLMRLLCGLERASAGTIKFEGQQIETISRERLARRVAYVPQAFPTVFPFTALEVVLTGRNPHLSRFGMESREDMRIALDALEQVAAGHLADRPVPALSGGERQLVFVARAIAQSPELLLLDEPASSLDLKHRAQLVQVLRRLRDERQVTSLVVTHDLMLLEPSFNEVFALGDGHVKAHGAPKDVLRAGMLQEVFGVGIHTLHEEGRIFVWSEA